MVRNIVGRTVITRPGAAVEVTVLHLSPAAEDALCAGDVVLPEPQDIDGLARLLMTAPRDEGLDHLL